MSSKIIFSDAMGRLRPSATLAFNQKVNELKNQGVPVINLSVGEPDFDTPGSIKQDAIAAIVAGKTRYTAVDGMEELKRAIQHKFFHDNGLVYEINQIVAATGAKQIIFNAMLATLCPNDEVIIPAPYWVSYVDIVEFCGATPIILPTNIEDDFAIDPKKLENAITDRTKWVILNSPSNPTGRVYTPQEIGAIAEVLRLYPHVLIMSDDIYEYLIFNDTSFTNIAMMGEDLKSRTLVVNGMSKGFAMTGWRLGYGAGPLPLIKAMVMLQSQSTSNPCTISQYAALSGLRGDRDFLPSWTSQYRYNRDLAYDTINLIPGLVVNKPGGAFYLLVGCAGYVGATLPDGTVIKDHDDVCYYLLNHGHVGVVPGSAFGCPNSFRLSYAVEVAVLEDALDRIVKAFSAINLSS